MMDGDAALQPLQHLFIQDTKKDVPRPLPSQEELDDLAKLKRINLPNYGIISLPQTALKACTVLEQLLVSNNSLNLIPPLVGDLTNLTVLYFSFNRLTSLPPLDKLVNLKQLFASSNQLSTFPPALPSSLEVLDLSCNLLKRVPPSIRYLHRLEELNLWNNQLEKLSPEIGTLNSLRRLWIDCNRLTVIPHEISLLTSLTEFHTHENPFASSRLKEGIENASSLPALMKELELDYRRHCRRVDRARVVLVGDGGMGKSIILASLEGKSSKILREKDVRDNPSRPASAGPSTPKSKMAGTDKRRAPAKASGSLGSLDQPEYEGGTTGGLEGHCTVGTKPHIQVNLLELGGFEGFKPAQSFFLQSSRCLYLLVMDAGEVDSTRLQYWLPALRAAAPSVPIIGVVTYSDANVRINERFLERAVGVMQTGGGDDYPIETVLALPLNLAAGQVCNIDPLRHAISHALSRHTFMQEMIPPCTPQIVQLVTRLRADRGSHPVMSWSDFHIYFSSTEVECSEIDLRVIAQLLHHWGMIFHPTPRTREKTSDTESEKETEKVEPSPNDLILDFWTSLLHDSVVVDIEWLIRLVYRAAKDLNLQRGFVQPVDAYFPVIAEALRPFIQQGH